MPIEDCVSGGILMGGGPPILMGGGPPTLVGDVAVGIIGIEGGGCWFVEVSLSLLLGY